MSSFKLKEFGTENKGGGVIGELIQHYEEKVARSARKYEKLKKKLHGVTWAIQLVRETFKVRDANCLAGISPKISEELFIVAQKVRLQYIELLVNEATLVLLKRGVKEDDENYINLRLIWDIKELEDIIGVDVLELLTRGKFALKNPYSMSEVLRLEQLILTGVAANLRKFIDQI